MYVYSTGVHTQVTLCEIHNEKYIATMMMSYEIPRYFAICNAQSTLINQNYIHSIGMVKVNIEASLWGNKNHMHAFIK